MLIKNIINRIALNSVLLLLFVTCLNTQMEFYKIENTNLQFIPPSGFISKNGEGMLNEDLNASFIFYSIDLEEELNFSPNFSDKDVVKSITLKCEVKNSDLKILQVELMPNVIQKQFICYFTSNKKMLLITGSMHGNKISWEEYTNIISKSFSTMKTQS